VLNNWGRKVYTDFKGKSVVFALGKRKKKKKRSRQRRRGGKVEKPLIKLWAISGMIYGKLLKKFIEDNLELLIGFDELSINEEIKEKLFRISPATTDRMLKKEKKRRDLKARSNTKPGTLLKNSIPIRTFADWDESMPGFSEVDLVSHNGGDRRGELDGADARAGWTETEAVRNKAQVYVFKAIKKKLHLPVHGQTKRMITVMSSKRIIP